MEVVTSTLIHLVLPLVGLKIYLWLCQRMKGEGVVSPPILAYFILFFTYGGLIQLILTTLFWYWSGMASLGAAYLLFIAPLILLITAFLLFHKKVLSRFHYLAYIASMSYVTLISIVWIGILFLKITKP